MTDCERFQNSLSDLIENQLQPTLKKDLESHLSGCKTCAETYHNSLSLKNVLSSVPKVKASPDFDIRLRTRLMEEMKKKESRLKGFSFGGNGTKLTLGISAVALTSMTLLFALNSEKEISSFPQVHDSAKIESKMTPKKAVQPPLVQAGSQKPQSVMRSNPQDNNLLAADSTRKSPTDIPKENLEDKIRYVKQK